MNSLPVYFYVNRVEILIENHLFMQTTVWQIRMMK
jgi:hypothetical protein